MGPHVELAAKCETVEYRRKVYMEICVAVHCVLVAAIIVKALKWREKNITCSILNQIELIFPHIYMLKNNQCTVEQWVQS